MEADLKLNVSESPAPGQLSLETLQNIRRLPDPAVHALHAIIRSGIPQTFRYQLPIRNRSAHRIARCFPITDEPHAHTGIAAMIHQYIYATIH